MKLLAIILFALTIQAQVDLGTITERTGIILRSDPGRKDFVRFVLEAQTTGGSNYMRVSLTNGLVRLQDLQMLPAGPVTLLVTSVHADGSQSKDAEFRFELVRDAPRPPTAELTALSGQAEQMETRGIVKQVELTRLIPPMAGGRMQTYDGAAMRKYFEERLKK